MLHLKAYSPFYVELFLKGRQNKLTELSPLKAYPNPLKG